MFVLLISWQSDTEDLLEQLEMQTTKDILPKKFPKRYTEPQAFDLTKPKPCPLPAPDLIPQQEKTKPVSNNLFLFSRTGTLTR